MNKLLKKAAFFFASISIICLVSIMKISLLAGTKLLHFSATNFLTPLLGIVFGPILAVSSILTFIFFKSFSITVCSPIFFLTFGIPGILSAMTMNAITQNKKILDTVLRIIFPAICMILFVISDSSYGYAMLFPLYWFIPMIAFIIEKFLKNNYLKIYLMSLSATFVAHAAGSIFFAYASKIVWIKNIVAQHLGLAQIPTKIVMSSNQWIALLPVVALERFIFAAGISIGYIIYLKLRSYNSSVAKNSCVQNYFYLKN